MEPSGAQEARKQPPAAKLVMPLRDCSSEMFWVMAVLRAPYHTRSYGGLQVNVVKALSAMSIFGVVNGAACLKQMSAFLPAYREQSKIPLQEWCQVRQVVVRLTAFWSEERKDDLCEVYKTLSHQIFDLYTKALQIWTWSPSHFYPRLNI